MNERIKELAEQAMWHTNSKTGEVYRTHFQFKERFAELIVRDCLYEMENTSSGDLDFAIWKIKKDYGIE